jgi:serine/threonine-protein kinase HipA
MKILDVHLNEDFKKFKKIGRLVDDNHRIYFEYDIEFIETNIWLSPFKIPLKTGLIEHKDLNFGPLFGLFDDSLPDGWGMLLMDRYFRGKELTISEISPLSRLAYLGSKTMGALTYHPATNESDLWDGELNLNELANQSYSILKGQICHVLPALRIAGGSPGGARPKVLVGIKDDKIIFDIEELPDGFAHWMIKFHSSDEDMEDGLLEYAYAMMAKKAGINIPEFRLFNTNKGNSYFGVKRFDRDGQRRYHTHTFGNLIHSNFRIPSCDYQDLLKVTQVLTKNHQDLLECFRLTVFNVFAHNRDDHVKNFSFIIGDDKQWAFAPAYDLTFSMGPGGEHSMTLAGEGKSPSMEHLLHLAKEASIENKYAMRIIDEVCTAINLWTQIASNIGISKDKAEEIRKFIKIPHGCTAQPI